MKQDLENIIKKLESDPRYAVRIIDAETLSKICINKTGQSMGDEYGSVADFFNDVFSRTQSVMIQPLLKNGSSWLKSGDVQKITVAPNEPTQAQALPPTSPTLLPTPALVPEIMPGLMGGLNAQAIYQQMDYHRLLSRNEKLEVENENLKEKIATLKEEALENKFSESKAAGNKEMLNGVFGMLPELLTAVGSLKGGGAVPAIAGGLASPAETEASEVKQNLISRVRLTTDAVTGYLLVTLRGIDTVTEFGTDLEELLIKHKLIPTE